MDAYHVFCRNWLEFSRWLQASLGPKRSRGLYRPGFFWSAYYFAHSGGQSFIHRRIALKRRIDAAAGYRGLSIRSAMLPNSGVGRVVDINILLNILGNHCFFLVEALDALQSSFQTATGTGKMSNLSFPSKTDRLIPSGNSRARVQSSDRRESPHTLSKVPC